MILDIMCIVVIYNTWGNRAFYLKMYVGKKKDICILYLLEIIGCFWVCWWFEAIINIFWNKHIFCAMALLVLVLIGSCIFLCINR